MFMDMFNAQERKKLPRETFYDGYVVNAILDAAYKSAKTKKWEPVALEIWRGKTGVTKDSHLQEYDDAHYLSISIAEYGGDDGMRLKAKSQFSGLIDLRDPVAFYYLALALMLLMTFRSPPMVW